MSSMASSLSPVKSPRASRGLEASTSSEANAPLSSESIALSSAIMVSS